jgi:hypothetical protein
MNRDHGSQVRREGRYFIDSELAFEMRGRPSA